MDQAHLFAIGVLLAWLAGIRVYLTVFGVGLAGFRDPDEAAPQADLFDAALSQEPILIGDPRPAAR